MSRSGFVSVPSSRSGSVVARALSCGAVWAFRPLPAGGRAAGFSPAPSCLFFGFATRSAAAAFAQRIGSYFAGCKAVVRSGCSGSPVFAACGLSVPAFVVKVVLPMGVLPSVYARRLLVLAVGGFLRLSGSWQAWLPAAGSSAPAPRWLGSPSAWAVPLVPAVPSGGVGCSSLAWAL